MISFFDNDEIAYLNWVAAHAEGFVVNSDRARRMPQYPMLHRSSHSLVSSPNIGNFTTGDYIKACGDDLDELLAYIEHEFEQTITFCRQCM